jgi:hypothetical protein
MTTRTQVTSLFQKFAGQSATLVIPRPYIDFCEGDHLAALLLSQILYWSERTDDPDGWFAKSYEDWHDELGLTDRQVKRIVKGDKRRQDDGFSLESVGIETKLARSDHYQGAATLHYRVNHAVLSEKINVFSQVPTIARNDQCGIPPIAQNDDPTIAQNDHIHRLDHKEKTTAIAVDVNENHPINDFKRIQEMTVEIVFSGNPKKWGAAGDIANWACLGSVKDTWIQQYPEAAFWPDEWKAFLLWYGDKGIAWPSNPEKWNGQAYEFRHDRSAHLAYMKKVAPRPVERKLTAEEKAEYARNFMAPIEGLS